MDELSRTAFLPGEEVSLHALVPEHAPLYLKWLNAPENRVLAKNPFPVYAPEIRDLLVESAALPQQVNLEILENATGCPLGLIGLDKISWVGKDVELTFSPADDGAGKEGLHRGAIELMLRYAFDELGLHRVYAGIPCFQTARMELLSQAGLRPYGALRRFYYFRGEYHDLLSFAALSHQWRKT